MRKLVLVLASALILDGALADDNAWVYTPETHMTLAPASSEGVLAGIDARERGFSANQLDVLDRRYWTSVWTYGDVNFGAVFFVITIK